MKLSILACPHRLKLRWQASARLSRALLPAPLKQWLFDPGSLTRHLRQICAGAVRVQVLTQYRSRPSPSEARLLGLRHRDYVWIREVHLLCNDQPWVFARTLVPASTLRGRCKRLLRLGARPLGDLLFTCPGVRRGPVEITRLTTLQPLYQRALGGSAQTNEAIWGRRSVFYLDDRPLLVCEFFLPALPIEPIKLITYGYKSCTA